MKKYEVEVFQFDELDDKAKEKAIDWFLKSYPDHDWWDSVYESFKDLCKTIGVEVDLSKTYFGLEYGSSFTADIPDIVSCIESINKKAWLSEFPKEDRLTFSDVSDSIVVVLNLIKAGSIYWQSDIRTTNRESSVEAFSYHHYEGEYISDLKNLDKVLEELEDYIQEIADELNHWLYRSLELEYEWLTSRENAIENIKLNEYEFTEDGKRFTLR